jgi:diguanylate cyclase (GGDEF)-like protein
MILILPRSKFHLSFSDSMIFLTFLLFGGEAAIFIATVEMFASCLQLKYKGAKFSFLALPFNIGSISVSTGITYIVWTFLNQFNLIDKNSLSTSNLLKILCILALSQFLTTSSFAAIYYALNTNTSPLEAWKKEGVPISITHFAGAGLAGIIFKLLNYADTFSIIVSFLVFAVIYYNYRQIIAEMTNSIEQAEQAERDKAEVERDKRIEVEKYADELKLSLVKEEATGNALRKNQKAFQHAALHDSLTQLPNRAYFGEIIKELIEETDTDENGKTFILFLDLARFKTINDSLGHTIGDKVLMVVAKRFLRMLRANDKVARLGGDEFAIILKGLPSVEKAEKVAWKIHQKISQPFSLSKNKIYTSVNIGIAPFTDEYETPEDILRDADIAMHYAKEKDLCVAVFTKELREHFVEKAVIEAELRFAIERNQLSIHYQPIVSLKDGLLIGFEALLRWTHPEKGFISPAQFIPIAENSGLIVPITTWILKETCSQLAKWQKISYAYRDLIVSVNISGKHLAFQSLLVDVEDALVQTKLSPASLKLEITESAAMENAEQSIRMLSHLKTLGVQLSIDDFGTGYSSLSYLHQLPFDTLKIDRSFVNSVGENGEDSQILQTIVSLAKNLKMRVIAEGIETEGQLGILQNLGCEYGQGYLMSKPQPVAVMDEQIRKKHFWLPQPKLTEENTHQPDLLNAKNAIVF